MNYHALALAALILLAVAGLSAFEEGKKQKAFAQEVDWEARIAVVGGTEAYQELAEFVAVREINKQHLEAHAFGAALYAVEGVEGLAACDERFSYGCFHEFLGRAIAAHGLQSVTELNERCRNVMKAQALSCQHGIGHGVLAALGYEEGHLLEALEVCETLPFNDPIGGCYSGVFMEYNVRTMLGEDARPREGSDPLVPCLTLPEQYRKACVYWQPQWWTQALFGPPTGPGGSPSPDNFARMGAYCKEFGAGGELQMSCFQGIGNITASIAQWEPELAVALCDSTSQDWQERAQCRNVVAHHFAIDVSKDVAPPICAGLPSELEQECLRYARNDPALSR